jgi:aerobic carbon-monoxide dehydrogenase medium subunit
MLNRLTQFHFPTTVEEACEIAGRGEGKNVFLAGGTHLAKMKDDRIEGLIDMSRLGLSGIKRTADHFVIGSMTPIQDIATTETLTGPAGTLLRQAAKRIGSTLLRNAITIGGNTVAAFYWSDMPPALLALDAEIVCRRGVPKRTVPAANLFATGPRAFLAHNELVTEVLVPIAAPRTGTAFIKFAKTANDYALISVATRLTLVDGRISEARIALNGLTLKPLRHLEAEQILIGQVPTEDLLKKAGQRAMDNLSLTKDFRASDAYRLEVGAVLVRRALAEALANA